jgi:hypothetical protein
VELAGEPTHLHEQAGFPFTHDLFQQFVGSILVAGFQVLNQGLCQLQSFLIFHAQVSFGVIFIQAVAAIRSKILLIFSCKVWAVKGLTM